MKRHLSQLLFQALFQYFDLVLKRKNLAVFGFQVDLIIDELILDNVSLVLIIINNLVASLI